MLQDQNISWKSSTHPVLLHLYDLHRSLSTRRGHVLCRDKESKKKKSKSTEAAGSPSGDEASDNGDDANAEGGAEVEWMTDTSAAAAQQRAQEQLTSAMAGMVTQGNLEAEQEAARKREEKRVADEAAAQKVSNELGVQTLKLVVRPAAVLRLCSLPMKPYGFSWLHGLLPF